jgi:hypothetical protein
MKVKEATQKQRDKEFEQNLSFEEWLDYFSKKHTSKEIDDMEKQSSNNPNYQPLKGA